MKASAPILSRVLLAATIGAAGMSYAKDIERPVMPLPTAEEIPAFCSKGQDNVRQHIAALEARPAPKAGDGKKVFKEWNDLQIVLRDFSGPLSVLSNMSPDKAVRAAAEACLRDVTKLSTELYQNEKLLARVKAVKPADKIDAKMQRDIVDAYEDTGATLPAEKRARMKVLLERLNELGQEFDRNIRDNGEKVTFSAEEMKGLPESFLARAKRDEQGNYQLGFSSPEYVPFMDYADNAEARRRYSLAYSKRGTAKNLDVLKEALALRKEMAGLFDLSSYAQLATRRRMAQNPEAVDKFLREVKAAAEEAEQREVEELRAFRAQAEGTPLAQTQMNRWDVSYWQEKLKKARYDINQNDLRKYFPTQAAVDWALHISSKLYGVSFKQVDIPVWHKDVAFYDVIENKSGKRIAGIYLDIYPREGKYAHAAAWPMRGVSTLEGRTPISVLVTNFDRVGLSGDEMRTLVHEFGHVLHGVLSNTRYVSHAGTAVERDFVEAPSQMFEEWARVKESLALLPQFCKDACPSVDDETLKRMTAARNFGRGVRYGRQVQYASLDMAMHGATPADPLPTWGKIESASPSGALPGSEFPGTFAHTMRGYSAGYYGYLWSEVMALDMLSRFNGKLMDPAVGAHYRKTVLSRGGELSGGELLKDFLGRAPSSKAFFDEIKGKRLQ